MEMMDMAADDTREELRRKLRSNFDGRIVRKDLTKKIKEGANVPVYVLEFLLGQYCSSDDTEHNRPVIMSELKTKAAHRDVPLPDCLAKCLREAKENSTSDYVVANSEGEPLSYTQFKRLWQYIVTRTVKERSYYRYENGKRVKHTVKPVLGERAAHNGKVVYSLDFEVTPHLLRHTYITNLIHASVDPKTVQYLAGHENSKITMDIYAKAKYNRPDELAGILEDTFTLWDAE